MAVPVVLGATLMAWVFAALRIFLVANVVGFVLRVLVAFGLNIVLVEPAVEAVMSIMTGQFNILPGVAADWIGFFNLDRYVGLIISAYSIQFGANYILKINR